MYKIKMEIILIEQINMYKYLVIIISRNKPLNLFACPGEA